MYSRTRVDAVSVASVGDSKRDIPKIKYRPGAGKDNVFILNRVVDPLIYGGLRKEAQMRTRV